MMIRKYLQKLVPSTVQVFGIATALIAAMIFILGYLHQYTDSIAPFIDNIARDFYANASSELLSIVITILVLDRLNERRQNEKELARLKALLASNEAVVTKIAIAELHAKGWLKNGTLKYAHLIKGANLEKANLLSANLQGIYLDSANLNNANLSYVNLEDADLWNANLENANLWNAKLISADLKGANLENANLLSANLQNANLRDTNLQNADLRLTNLQNTKLMRANLRNIRLNKANLCGADMTSANLEGAYLLGATLKHANLHGTIYNKDTILPDGTEWTPDTNMTRFGAVMIEDNYEWEAYLYQNDLLRQYLNRLSDSKYEIKVQSLRNKGLIE